MSFKLPTLADVCGTDPSRAVLDSFKVAIAKRVADALPPLTVKQVYQGVDYGGRRFYNRPPSHRSGVCKTR
jgi:arginyl-tRNA synthetase